MNKLIERIGEETYRLFTNQLFQIGEKLVSIISILQLTFLLIFVVFISRICKKIFKRKLLIKLGIDEGNREAIATIISYIITFLGFLIVLQTIGFNLASLAVLAGGLGVGIGFGLQDITKNFVSGLTLLLERKLNVGETLFILSYQVQLKSLWKS